MSFPVDPPASEALDVLSRFRVEFYESLYARADVLFELTDAALCTDGPVNTLVELSLAHEMRRGHGALYAALDKGWCEPARMRRALVDLPLPRVTDGRIALAVDVSNWLRPDANTSPDRLFCHVHGRRADRSCDQLIPGWPYSFVAALESGRTSWCGLLDAVRPGPADDATTVTAAQLRDVLTRIITHPEAQLRITDADGMRLTCFATNTADRPIAQLELRHRLRARAEDRSRGARATELRNLPLHDTGQNQVWLEIVQLALDLLAWMPMLTLTGQARLREPCRLWLRLFSAAGQLVTTGRHRLRLARHWPWTREITDALERLALLPNPG